MSTKFKRPTVILLALLGCAVVAHGQDDEIPREWEAVKCDHSTEVCECTGSKAALSFPDTICYFKFEIEQRHSFTRYILDNELTIPGFGGRVVYFDGLEEYPDEQNMPEGAQPPASCRDATVTCTDAFTVDGKSFRSIITVNSRFPGPTLIVPNNAIVVVDVSNTLDSESISIHWHGMHQMNTPWMDGVEHITQCGISPASSFRYIFRASPAGTHWYHSHSGAQRTDGLFGALIVREDSAILNQVKGTNYYGPFQDLPHLHTLTLIDWQANNSLELFTQIHGGIRFFNRNTPPLPPTTDNPDPRAPRTCSPDGVEVGPVSFWSGLINGRGKHRDVSSDMTRLSTFNVQRNQRYRFRLIGAQGLFAFRFSIDEHKLTLIATDGHFIKRREVDFIIIHSGERYDFILETMTELELDKTDFKIRAETLEVMGSNPRECEDDVFISGSQLFADHMAEATLHYGDVSLPSQGESRSKSVDCRSDKNCYAVNCPFRQFPVDYGIECIHIHELELLGLNSGVYSQRLRYTSDANTKFFNFGFEGDGSTSAMNGRNFRFPSEPLQLATETLPTCDLSTPNLCNSRPDGKYITRDCICTQIHDIDGDQTYRFVFTAVGPEFGNWNFAHPVHLHGHSFYVTEIGFGTYAESRRVTRASGKINCNNDMYCTNPSWASGVDPDRNNVGRMISPVPPLKDTVLVPAGGYAVVYFTSNNPGYWFLHCHIEVHQLEGMAVVINETGDKHNPPPLGMDRCRGSFTDWDVETFKNRERLLNPTPSPTITAAPKQPIDYFLSFIISVVAAGVFGVLFVLLLTVIIVVMCCYYCRRNSN